jgi:hypothetical protein
MYRQDFSALRQKISNSDLDEEIKGFLLELLEGIEDNKRNISYLQASDDDSCIDY